MIKNFINTIKQQWQFLYILVFLIAALALFLSFVWISQYARFAVDDYHYSYLVREMGFWEYQVHHYETWAGRFGVVTLVSVFHPMGTNLSKILPFAVLIIWYINWYWLTREAALLFSIPLSHTGKITIPLLLISGTLASQANIRQVLYWVPGVINYLTPLLGFPLILALICRYIRLEREKDEPGFNWAAPAAVLAAFFFGAFTEIYTLFQLTLFTTLTVLAWFVRSQGRKAALRILLPVTIAAVLVLVVVSAAPGNAHRRTLFPSPLSPVDLVVESVLHFFYFLKQITGDHAGMIGFVLFGALMIGLLTSSSYLGNLSPGWLRDAKFTPAFLLLGVPVFCFGVLFALFAGHAWGTSTYPVARTLSVPTFWFFFSLTAWGFLAGGLLRSELKTDLRLPAVVLLLVASLFFVAGPGNTLFTHLTVEYPEASAFAREWDHQHELILQGIANGEQDIVVPGIPNYYNLEVLAPRSDEFHYPNWAMARFFQVNTISAPP